MGDVYLNAISFSNQTGESICWLMRVLISVLLTLTAIHANGAEITVKAGELNRQNSIVTFHAGKLATNFTALKQGGSEIPLQYSDGKYSFILPSLEKGQSARYQLTRTRGANGASAQWEGTAIKLAVGSKPAFYYQARPTEPPRADIKPSFKRGGYIHPVLTPSGAQVTDDYPRNHIHHHGIWFPWTKTKFEGREPDFWNMGQETGTIEPVAVDAVWSGPVHAGFSARHRFVDLTASPAKTALNETWEVKLFARQGGAHVFDLVSTQTCATSAPLELPKFYYGGLGVRGNWAWNGKGKAYMMTSSGETNVVKGNETRGKWFHVGGLVDGKLAGMAVLCHPSNFRFPQPLRLHPSEPFVCFAPSQLGDWEISPGKPYVSKYRFVVADGPASQEKLEQEWQDYASPVTVEIASQ